MSLFYNKRSELIYDNVQRLLDSLKLNTSDIILSYNKLCIHHSVLTPHKFLNTKIIDGKILILNNPDELMNNLKKIKKITKFGIKHT